MGVRATTNPEVQLSVCVCVCVCTSISEQWNLKLWKLGMSQRQYGRIWTPNQSLFSLLLYYICENWLEISPKREGGSLKKPHLKVDRFPLLTNKSIILNDFELFNSLVPKESPNAMFYFIMKSFLYFNLL